MKNHKSILLAFPILILAWGCYTTSQHPLVHFDDEGELNLFSISVYDECKDCHDSEALEEFKSLHKPMLAAVSNYNFEYYEGDKELENYYNNKPWWFEYNFNSIVEEEKEENQSVEIIVYQPEPRYPIKITNPPPSIANPVEPPTTSPPKYRQPENPVNDRNGSSSSAQQEKTDPDPRNRDGGGRGNSSGRR